MDDSNPHEIIPISFTLKSIAHNHFYQFYSMNKISKTETNKYLIQTRSQAKSSGIKVPEIHGANKGINPHVTLGRQRPLPTLPMHGILPTNLIQPFDKELPTHPITKPRIGQGRARLKRKIRTNQLIPLPKWMLAPPIQTPAPKEAFSLPEPTVQSKENVQPQHHIPIPLPDHQPVDPTHIIQLIGTKIQHRPSPPYYYLYARPPPRPPDVTNSIDSWKDLLETDLDRNVDIEENSPFQEGIISETYERPDKSYVQEPHKLKDLIDTTKLVQKFLPKQTDIDKILDIIKRKVLKGTHLPLSIKEIQAGYLSSLYFKDLYLFLSQNKLPSKRSSIKKIETLAENFVLLDSLLFKLVTTPNKEMALLAIPEICVDKIIALYHASLFAGHQGEVKMYLTIKDKIIIPNLMHYLRSFIKGCHIRQLVRSDKPPMRQLQSQIYLNYRPLSKISMDLKVMPRSQKGNKFILCIIDEMTNYLITVPIYHSRSEEVGEALIEHIIAKYCAPNCTIMDQYSAFMSTLMNYLFRKFNIKIKIIAPYNHHSLQVEHGIKLLSRI